MDKEHSKTKLPITLTPLPDIETYYPEEWKNLDSFGLNVIKPEHEENKWFNLPLSEKKAEWQEKSRDGYSRGKFVELRHLKEKFFDVVDIFSDGEEI